MRIGFLGIQCDNDNLGVSALAYAGLGLVDRVAPEEAEFVLFSDNSEAGMERMRDAMGMGARAVRAVPFRHKNPRRLGHSMKQIAGCDIIIDFSGGDSFSDMYGLKRIAKLLFHKQIAIQAGVPLVLAPQTYGPFEHGLVKLWVKHVVRRARQLYAGDSISRDFLTKLAGRDAILTTDVAVTLPYEPSVGSRDGVRVGFNVSGLLWAGGYTKDNQFGLATDYRAYCARMIEALLDAGMAVALVAHVPSKDPTGGEDDFSACAGLHARYPETIMSPRFTTPVEAKTYIADTDVFLGPRMHATIAAFTAGVPTIPLAYSRKFEGFYGSLNYPAVVDLTALDTDAAVTASLSHVENREALLPMVGAGSREAQRRIQAFPQGLARLFAGR